MRGYIEHPLNPVPQQAQTILMPLYSPVLFLVQSKKFFNHNNINTKNFSVCYPWGSYNNDTKKLMENLNLSFGLTSNTGNFNLSSKINKFFLPRFDANVFENI